MLTHRAVFDLACLRRFGILYTEYVPLRRVWRSGDDRDVVVDSKKLPSSVSVVNHPCLRHAAETYCRS